MNEGVGALIYNAIHHGRADELDQLLTPQNVNEPIPQIGYPPPQMAINIAQYECVLVCIKKGANIANMCIHQAYRDPRVLLVLLDMGADPNNRDPYYGALCALDTAVRFAGYHEIWLLIDYGGQMRREPALKYPQEAIDGRERARKFALITCAMRRIAIDKNIMRLIGKQIWSHRQIFRNGFVQWDVSK